MKCKHLNCAIHEHWLMSLVFDTTAGVLDLQSEPTQGNPTGTYFFQCKDCGFYKQYKDGNKMPKWVAKHIENIKIAGR